MSGWIKIHRQILDSEIWTAERFSKGQAWVDLLMLANYQPRTIFIRGIELRILKGQVAYSQLSLAKRWQWNCKTIVTFLRWLEKRGMVETKTNNQTTVITIKNYSLYQTDGEQSGDQNGDQKDTKTETNKNIKNIKNIKTVKTIRDKKEIKKEINPEIKYFINYAFDTFQKKTGEKLLISGQKDGAIIKELLKTYPSEKLSTLWSDFINTESAFLSEAGYSIGVFRSQINKLLTRPLGVSICVRCKKDTLKHGDVIINMPEGGVCGECRKKA